jgi:hypothetical protein
MESRTTLLGGRMGGLRDSQCREFGTTYRPAIHAVVLLAEMLDAGDGRDNLN